MDFSQPFGTWATTAMLLMSERTLLWPYFSAAKRLLFTFARHVARVCLSCMVVVVVVLVVGGVVSQVCAAIALCVHVCLFLSVRNVFACVHMSVHVRLATE